MYQIEWRDIIGFEGYAVSSCGLIKSKNRFVGVKTKYGKIKIKPVNERILKAGLNGNGYEIVTLRRGNKAHIKVIHRIVAEHFCEGNKKGLVVHHKDNDKRNNHHTNLEYTTKQKKHTKLL